jgi:hypothetical protein
MLTSCSGQQPPHRFLAASPSPSRSAAAWPTPIASPDEVPVATDPTAFHGFGKLAFVAQGHIWLLDGETDRLVDLGPGPERPLMGWPATGKLYLWRPGAQAVYHDPANGSVGGRGDLTIWSPVGDEIVTAAAAGVVITGQVAGEVAVSVQGLWHDGTVLGLEEPTCISCRADGQRPLAIRPDGSRLKLPVMLRAEGLRSWSPDHSALLVTQGGSRVLWEGKSLAVCDSSATCQTLPQPEDWFHYQGRWSPDGSRLVFLRAPVLPTPGFPTDVIRAWYAAHELWTSKPDGSDARRVDPVGGAVYAEWAADGRHLLEIRGGQLWLLDSETGASRWIAGPLDSGELTYYGWYDWPGRVSWLL